MGNRIDMNGITGPERKKILESIRKQMHSLVNIICDNEMGIEWAMSAHDTLKILSKNAIKTNAAIIGEDYSKIKHERSIYLQGLKQKQESERIRGTD